MFHIAVGDTLQKQIMAVEIEDIFNLSKCSIEEKICVGFGGAINCSMRCNKTVRCAVTMVGQLQSVAL